MQGDDRPAAVRLHAERRRRCSARAGEPRSTPESACFTTCPDAALACAAREVTLYLAVTSLRRPAVFSDVSSLALRASSDGPVLGPAMARMTITSASTNRRPSVAEIPPGCLHDEGHRLWWPSKKCVSQAPSPRLLRLTAPPLPNAATMGSRRRASGRSSNASLRYQ